MPLYALDEKLWFPPVDGALEDGLWQWAATSAKSLAACLQKRHIPWFDGDVPLWWCPDPRFVLFPMNLK